jgi:flagellar protein FlaG
MASVSVSHMILFIASMLIAASVAGVFTSSVDQLSGAIDDQGLEVSDSVRTDVEIISDAGGSACVYNCSDQGELVLLVKNTGTRTLPAEADQIEVIVDGQFRPASTTTVEVLDGANRWRSSDVVRVTVGGLDLAAGDHRAKIIVDGDEEVFEFRT